MKVESDVPVGRPDRVAPVEATLEISGGRFDYRFPALSVTVLRWRAAR